MLKKILPILLALTILLAACAPQGTPTMAPADVQGTAVSSAWTMVAMTQAANPTNTQLPPTEVPSPTSLPTFTPAPLLIPTLAPLILPTATRAASDPKDCNKPLSVGEAGPTNPMRIENESGGVIYVISFYLNPNAFGQCGYVAYNNIRIGATQIINLPKGNWWATAMINYKNGQASNSQGGFIIRPGDWDLLRIIVKKDTIGVIP